MPAVDGLGRSPADPQAILPVLARHDADFLIIGGLAVIVHGYPRATFDLDILPAPDVANMTRLSGALAELEAHTLGEGFQALALDLGRPESLAVGNLFLGTNAGALDLSNGPRPDLKRYRRLEARATSVHFGEHSYKVIGRADLIAMKRDAGRDKDMRDIAALTEVERGGPISASD